MENQTLSNVHSAPAAQEVEAPNTDTKTEASKIEGDSQIEPTYTEYLEVKGQPFVNDYVGTVQDRPALALLDEYIYDQLTKDGLPDSLESARSVIHQLEKELHLPKISLQNLGLVGRHLRLKLAQETIDQRRSRLLKAIERLTPQSRFG